MFSLCHRLRRDITERGRDLEGVLKQYNKFVKPVRLVASPQSNLIGQCVLFAAGLPAVH